MGKLGIFQKFYLCPPDRQATPRLGENGTQNICHPGYVLGQVNNAPANTRRGRVVATPFPPPSPGLRGQEPGTNTAIWVTGVSRQSSGVDPSSSGTCSYDSYIRAG